MGSVGGMLGLAGGAAGSGFSGPQAANIQTPTTDKQAQDAYTSNQAALDQQNQFLQALQAQNGIQNQNNVYSQLQGIANGTGPNPAQAQLAQATGANVANQAALMAGQRGSAQNAGMIARQAAQAGGNLQQQAAGQAATLQAQQSLNAVNNMGNVAGQQVGNLQNATAQNTQAQQNEQQQLLNAIAQQNNANVGMQSNVNSANAGLASTTMGQQAGLIGGVMNGAGAMLAEGGEVPKQRYVMGGSVQSYDTDNQDQIDYSQPQQPVPQSPIGQVPTAASVHAQMMSQPLAQQKVAGPSSSFAKFMKGATASSQSSQQQPQAPLQQGTSALTQGLGRAIGNMFKSSDSNAPITGAQVGPDQMQSNPGAIENDGQTALAAKGGKVPALVSPGEIYLKPNQVGQVLKGADPTKVGEHIPGKPKVSGAKNSYANDTVKKTLDEGGIVLPRTVTKSKGPSEAGRRFVETIAKKHGMKVT